MSKRFRPAALAGCSGLLAILGLVLMLTRPAIGAATVGDGLLYPAYGPALAVDPAGDLASPGPADWVGTRWTDVISLHVTNDTQNLYVLIPLPSYDHTESTGSFGLAVATGRYTATGGSAPTDPWGNAITLAYTATLANVGATPVVLPHRIIPDVLVRGNIVGRDCCGFSDNGWTELRRWNGSDYGTGGGQNWGGLGGGVMVGERIAFTDGGGFELAVPLSALDLATIAGAQIHLQFYATQTEGSKGAYDMVPSDDQSTGWNDPTTQRYLATYILTATQDVIVTAPAEGAHFVRPMIAVTGYVTPTGAVSVSVTLDASGPFYPALDSQGRFAQPVTLSGGCNTITVNAQSALGSGVAVRRVTYGPLVTIAAPEPGQHFVATVADVLGVAAPAEGVTVTLDVNGTVYTPVVDPASGAFAQVVPLQNGVNTITTTAANVSGSVVDVRRVTQGSASHDDDVWWGCLGHMTRDEVYRDPWGAQPAGSTVTLRVRACAGDLTGATLYAWPANLAAVVAPMTVSTAVTDPLGDYEYWEAAVTLPVTPTVFFYKLQVTDGSDTDWYVDDIEFDGRNGWGRAYDNDGGFGYAFDVTVYDPDFEVPDWLQNAVVYQIFSDRFRDGDPTNNVVSGTYPFYENPSSGITYTTWNASVIDPRAPGPFQNRWSQDFCGGDLQGVIDQLDYLHSLGVTAVYLNPIFWSPSNHKYDTTDFGRIDPRFGDEDTFGLLLAEAEARGMVVVLDGVFNHASSDSVYFDRYGRHPTLGACESPVSPYRDWFRLFDVTPGSGPCVGSDGSPNGANYQSWWGYDTLPLLNSEHAEVRQYFWDHDPAAAIGGKWIVSGALGWRLDVGGDIDSGAWHAPTNDYWEGFRQTVKEANPEAAIFGEEWGDARSWLLGAEWDSVMNYRFRSALLSFMRDRVYRDNDNNDSSSGGTLRPITVSEFDRWLRQIQEDYPPQAWYGMVNLVGSHDTNRVRFVLGKWQLGYDQDDPLPYDPATDFTAAATDRRQMLMAILQFTLPGSPMVYYGDEVGIDAPGRWYGSKWEDDPYNRVPFPWDDTPGDYVARDDVRSHYARLGKIRGAHPALRTGTFDTLLIEDARLVYAFGRTLGTAETAVVIVNRGAAAQTVTVDLAGHVADGTRLTDRLNQTQYTVSGGKVTLDLAGEWGAILTTTPEHRIYLPLVLRGH